MKILVRRGMACGDSVMASCVLEPLAKKYPRAEIHYESNFPEVFGKGFPSKRIKIMKAPKYGIKEYDLVFDLGGNVEKVSRIKYHAPLPHHTCSICGVPFNPPKIYCKAIKTKYSVGICPNTGRSKDTWLPEKFQELINRLDAMGFKCISFGPKGAPRFENCKNFYPKYEDQHQNFWGYGAKGMCEEVHKSARIMKGLDVVVAGDTGLLHVADAVGAAVVALLTAGSPEFDFYLNHRSSQIVRSTTNMVADLDVLRVFNAVQRVLFEQGRLVYE